MAKVTEQRLRTWIIGNSKKLKNSVWTNPEDTQVMWEVDCDAKTCIRISKNVSLYDNLIKGLFQIKAGRKALEMMADNKEDVVKLEEMLKEHTTIEIIKEATAQEMVDEKQTWLQRLKSKFQKSDPQ